MTEPNVPPQTATSAPSAAASTAARDLEGARQMVADGQDQRLPHARERQDPQVSVVIPCYNQGEFILEAIASVEDSCELVPEIIVVNDGSTDARSLEIFDHLKQQGYHVIDSDNQGLSAARNLGIQQAQGHYILPLDADNRIAPHYLSRAAKILDQDPRIGVVYGNPEFFGEAQGTRDIPALSIRKLLLGNYIDACAVFRRRVWEDCQGFDPKIPEKLGYEDWDFWLGAIEAKWEFHHLDAVMFYYRIRSNSMVSACNLPENREKLFRYICTKHSKLYAVNFAAVFAEKEAQRLTAMDERDHALTDAEQLRLDLEHGLASQRESYLQQDNLKAEIAQLEQHLKTAHQDYMGLKKDYDHLSQQLSTVCQQLDELEHVRVPDLEGRRQTADYELSKTCQQLEVAQNRIHAMETSKFWQIRSNWIKVKRRLGLVAEVDD
jgi:GT2 family glycosyltransferase